MNEERRTDKKLIKSIGEKCKVSLNIRRDANEELKKLLKAKEIGINENYEKKSKLLQIIILKQLMTKYLQKKKK